MQAVSVHMLRMSLRHTVHSVPDAHVLLCLLRGKPRQIKEKETSVKTNENSRPAFSADVRAGHKKNKLTLVTRGQMAQQQPHPLFTLDLLLASGCEDNAQTRKMVEELNRISQVLGRELMSYLEKIVNTVKSKTDELRSVIDFGAPEKSTPDQTIKRLEEELQQQRRNSEKLGSELKAQRDANKDLKREVAAQEINFRTFFKSHNIKCLEIDHSKYEVIQHSICLDNNMVAFNQAKAALGASIAKKDKEIAELRTQLVAPVSPEVILKFWRCDFLFLFHPFFVSGTNPPP